MRKCVLFGFGSELQTNFKITLQHDAHILDEKSMKHDVSEAIVLQGGKQ